MAQQLLAQGQEISSVIMVDSFNMMNRPKETRVFFQDAERIINDLKIDKQGEEAQAIRTQYQQAYQLLSVYQPKFYKGEVVLLKAQEIEPLEEEYSFEMKSWSEHMHVDQTNGWRDILPNLRILNLQGSHSRLFDHAYIGQINERFEEIFAQQKNIYSL